MISSFNLHGVVKVSHYAWRFPRRWAMEAGVVDVADDALNPGHGAHRWQGFVWEVTCNVIQRETDTQIILGLKTMKNTWQDCPDCQLRKQ